ncbi:16S rRNA (guanine(527)-N(7))-methyltransferase RsmG [Fusicatenibacter sp.]|uniref:16S rRNA (guanine(527)-N(7))-methyltransferase RsmG n=1 Tax=Fusicatenibacter sp. TaxID=2773922 RepID=UPI00399C1849
MDKMFAEQMERELEGIASLSERQMEQFYQYYEMLVEWNQVMNLTAITEMTEVVTKHFVDSLSLKKAVSDLEDKPRKIMDVGTGAGFPGIPLKIAFPRLEITLLDSLNKRIRFLDAVIEKLELKCIKAVHGRAEDYGRDGKYREQYDLCVSRAVANLSTLSEYCLPFVKTGGYFIPYKSGKVEEELAAASGAVKKLGSEVERTEDFLLPNGDERTLVVIRKNKVLEKRYPRKAGLPGKDPLK